MLADCHATSQREVSSLETKITKHVNDVIQKYASSLFRNTTLEFYGVKTAPIKELINPELPVVYVGGRAADIVFLLEDDTYLHFDFETGHSREVITRCAGYDLRLYERDGRTVHTVIVYTAEVKKKLPSLNIGSLVYNPDVMLMGEYDGNAIFAELESKIKARHELTDLDMFNLVLLPLMRHTIPRQELAANSIKLAQTIPDATKRNACIAAAFAFASKYLHQNETNKLLEVLRMTDLAVMLVENEIIKIAKNLLRRGISISAIVEDTGLNEATIQQLQAEIEMA